MGSFIGGILRYLCTLLPVHFALAGYWATLFVNVIGCLAIGYFTRILGTSQPLSLLLITGFCGSFTTFSTFIKDASLLTVTSMVSTILYLLVSLTLGYLFFILGSKIG